MGSPFNAAAPVQCRGFSLIEIMIGLVITLVATLAIFQVFSSSSANNRTTQSGSEAQISGNIGSFKLERDLQGAGMGFGTLTNAGAGCSVLTSNPAVPGTDFNFPLVPVLITAGAAGAPDRIDVLYGNSSFMVVGRGFNSGTATSKTTVARGGIQLGDLVVVTNSALPPTVCELVEITDNTAADKLTVSHGQGLSYTNFYTGAQVSATRNRAATTGLNGSGSLFNLGPQPKLNQWAVAGNSLVVTDLLGAAVQQTVAEGIVLLKAQYGLDDGGSGTATANDGIISTAEWTNAAPADWSKVLAVRFAVLSRSQQLEKTPVSANPSWVGGAFDMSAQPANWPYYRYRVYEGVVAMRNMIWGTSP